jgi:hypothetical protein
MIQAAPPLSPRLLTAWRTLAVGLVVFALSVPLWLR